MEFASDARPLVDACFQSCVELPRQLPQSQLIEHPKQCQKRGHKRQTEPDGLVIGWGDGKVQERAGFVPHAAVVGRNDAEAIVTRRKISVESLSPIASFLPIAVASL